MPPRTAPTTGSAAAALVVAVAGAPLQQPGDHGRDHFDVAHLLGRHVHDQVLVLAGHPAAPALEQVLHRDCHFAVRAADQLLQLAGVHRVGLLRRRVELQVYNAAA
jgi:hypothetical protein